MGNASMLLNKAYILGVLSLFGEVKQMSFNIDKVADLPIRMRQSTGVYESLLLEISKKDVGTYAITVGTNKSQTIYQQLSKKMKGREDLKGMSLHRISDKVYIVKTATGPKKK